MGSYGRGLIVRGMGLVFLVLLVASPFTILCVVDCIPVHSRSSWVYLHHNVANPIVSHQQAVVYGIYVGLGLLHCIFIKRSDLLFKIQTVTHEILRSSMPTAALSPDVISFWVRKTVGSLGHTGKRSLEQLQVC